MENPNDEGSYYCDCSTAGGDFAGLFCEYEAENYCRFPQEVTSSWFCTNKGTCVVAVNADKSQWNCDCSEEYEGPHCEFINGALPSDWPGIDQVGKLGAKQKSDDGLEAGITAVIVLVCLLVVALIALFIIQKRRVGEGGSVGQNAPKDHSEALNLEVDGEVLKEAVKSLKSSNADQFDFEDVDVPMEVSNSQKMTQYEDKNGNSNGVGHGRMV